MYNFRTSTQEKERTKKSLKTNEKTLIQNKTKQRTKEWGGRTKQREYRKYKSKYKS